MEKEIALFDDVERASSEGSDTYTDLDTELSAFLTDSRQLSLRARLSSRWKTAGTKSSLLLRHLPQVGFALLPSYVSGWIVGGPKQPKKLYPTSALDGLRGFACFFVFNFHLLFTYSDMPQFGYGFADNKWFHQLPFLRLIYAGPAMVAIFFVISGYVLSHKPLRLARKRSWEQAMHTISSSVFRRALRLFLPTIIGTFITMLLVQAGMFKYSSLIRQDGETLHGNNEEHPPRFDSFWTQLWDWQISLWQLTNPWTWGTFYNLYDPHLWTIPVEFRSSMVLFITIVGLARLRASLRMLILALLIWYCIECDRWEILLFLSGMFLAEVDLITGIFESPSTNLDEKEGIRTSTKPWSRLKKLKRPLWILVFLLGLYLSSSPNGYPESTPGYRYLMTLVPKSYGPKYRWWQSVGAILIVLSVNNSPDVQPLFTNRFAQYLGNISYAFYIVHGPVLHSLGYVAMKTAWGWTGKETTARLTLGFFLGWCVVMPTVFWAADLFWRGVDGPCVRFARWVEGKCEVKSG